MNIVMKKCGILFLCAALFLGMLMPMGAVVQATESGIDLSMMQIVLPVNSTAVENTAAAELQTYIRKITGTTLTVIQEGSNSGAGIYVGATQYAQQQRVTWPTEGDEKGEAWAIQEVDGNLVLCGAQRRGTLYAVYHLLEDVLGVRWWNLWEEEVPTGTAIVPVGYSDSGTPVMEYRDVFISGYADADDYTYFVRNRVNGSTSTGFPNAYGGKETYALPAHTHTFSRYFPAEFDSNDAWMNAISSTGGDFSSNPEWYSMDENGNRISDGQLCLSNSGLRTEFANRLLKNIAYSNSSSDAAGTPRPFCYAIVPNDNERYCQCTNCQTVITEKGYSYYVLSFVNELADKVTAAGYTDVVLEMLVYWNYVEPPKDLVPRENVSIRFADNYTDLLHGLNHSNNADTLARLREWSELCSNKLYYWQYVVNYNNNGIFPSMFHYGETFTTLAEMGVDGWFAEQEQCINVDFWDMKLWLITKLMENPVTGDEYTALMDEFIYGYYGEKPGKYIREYLYYMHGKAEQTNADQGYGTHIIGAEWLGVEDILFGNNCFEKAFKAAQGDTLLQSRLRKARSGLDRVIVENFARWTAEAKENGLTLPFTKQEVGERIYQTMQEQINLRGEYDPDYPQFFNRYDRYSDKLAPLPEELANIDRDRILEYTVNDFRVSSDYTVIDDSDSLTGKTVCCDASTRGSYWDNPLLLHRSEMSIGLYDADTPDEVETKVIGTLGADDIQANQGYQLYKFSWTVPAISDNLDSFVYILKDWGVQIALMSTDMREYTGQVLDVYLSMKVEGNISPNFFTNTSEYPVFYIDRVFVIVPQTAPVKGILSEFKAGDFSLPYAPDDKVVEDALSVTGSAALIHTDAQDLILQMYSKFADSSEAYTPIGQISVAELQANEQRGGYAIYKFDDVVILPAAGEENNYLYMFGNWGFQIPMHTYGEMLEGKLVDVYLSMKVEGINGSTPAYYIDRVIITYADPDIAVHENCVFGNYVYQGDAQKGALPSPPESVSELMERADGDDILAQFDYQNLSLPYGAYYGDAVVADTDSSIGQAATFSYAARSSAGNAGLADAMTITETKTLKLYAFAQNIRHEAIGEITAAELQANAQRGGYTLYKFDNVDIMPAASDGINRLFLFDCEGLRAELNDYKDTLTGQIVDIYLSLKVTGDVTNTTDNTPAYYIDSLIITTADAMEAEDANADAVGTMVGTCIYGCGKTNTVPASGKHIKLFTADDFRFAGNESGILPGDSKVLDPDSVMETVLKRESYVNGASRKDLVLNGGVKLEFDAYPGNKGIASLKAEDIKANQGYQLYKFSFESFEIASDASFVYMFNDWQLQSTAMAQTLKEYNGKAIDIYLSMKVTGDVTGTTATEDAADNWPVYYIDRVMVVEKCSFGKYASDNNTTCETDGTRSRSCSICGLTEYAADVAIGHDFSAEVAEGRYQKSAATCVQAAVYYTSCSVCGVSSQGCPDEETFVIGELLSHNFIEGICTACQKNAPVISSASLTLESTLRLNISVNMYDHIAEEFSIRVTIGQDTKYQSLSGDFAALIPAHRLNDDVRIELVYNNQVIGNQVWTMDAYAKSLRKDHSDDAKMMALLDALCNYGDYAAYYGAKATGTAPGITVVEDVEASDLEKYKHNITTRDEMAALKPVAALYLDDACDIRVKFDAAAWGDNKLLINGDEVSIQKEGQRVVYIISDLVPQQWDDVYIIEVKDGYGNIEFAVNYSVLSYVYGQLNKSQEAEPGLNNLLRAMFLYNQAADAYLNT